MEIKSRIDTINFLIQKFGFKKYLEIGVRNVEDCFDRIKCQTKHSVDPGLEAQVNMAEFKMTSDDFFSSLNRKKLKLPAHYEWDVIFIDGLHLAEQVYRDISNSLEHLAPGGFVVMHDCDPFLFENNIARLVEDYWGQNWNGTVWKAFYHARANRLDIDACTLSIDEGVGVLKKRETPLDAPAIKHQNTFFEYKVFFNNREETLNIIGPDQLDKWSDNPFINQPQ
jgi:hypothetical protein